MPPPIDLTRPRNSLVGVYLGKRFDRHNPLAQIMLIVLVGLFLAGAVLITTGFWYLGVASLAAMICLLLLIPVSRRRNTKDST
jgi:CHASE2 domain-containing sensor protein